MITINTATEAGTLVGSLNVGLLSIDGLAFDPNSNTLYGVDTLLYDQLFSINTATGAGTAIGALLALRTSGFDSVVGLAFDPGSDTLYGTDIALKKLITINPTTSVGTLVGATHSRADSDAMLDGLAYLY